MQAKEKVFERIGQTFELYKNNFVPLTVLIFVVTFAFQVWFLNIMFWIMGSSFSTPSSESIGSFYSVWVIIGIIFFIIWFLVYLMILIPATIATIKGVQQAYTWEVVDPKQNLRYAISNFLNTLRTYWYIFAYVALIPALIFIVAWLLFIIGTAWGIGVLSALWWVVMWIAVIVFIVFAIYRWIRSTFSLYNAVDKDEYTKINFQESLWYTENLWWRIVWNMIVIWIIGAIIWMIVGFVAGLVWIGATEVSSTQMLSGEVSSDAIGAMMNNIWTVSIFTILESILTSILQSFTTVLGIIFGYIFLKRLAFEKGDEIENITAKKEVKKAISKKTEEL